MSEQTAIKSALERLREVAPLIRERSMNGQIEDIRDPDQAERSVSYLAKNGLSQPWEILLESSQRSWADVAPGLTNAAVSDLITVADAGPGLSLQIDEASDLPDPYIPRHLPSGWWLIPGLLVGLLFWGLLLRWLL
ncbi:MAG: hypothetical protein H9533_14910 [Rhodobacteraceae bacterium]|nr:hypothetical protein [Paracoccaceae bacterium]